METEEEVDYSEDPHLDRVIFGCLYFSSTAAGPSLPSKSFPPISSPVVALSGHHSAPLSNGNSPQGSPALNLPPLSLGTLHFMSTIMPLLPSFDPHLPNSSFFVTTSAGPHPSVATNPSAPLHLPSGCFETPTVRVRSVKSIPLDGSLDPLTDHPYAPHTGKKRTKCMKATSKDISIRFGETSAIGEAAIMAIIILVGHVHGRAYSATQLTQWVKEIWRDILKELPEVQVLPRGWFALHFAK